MPFAALQKGCQRCAVGNVLDSGTKSSGFAGTETENQNNLHKGYFRIYNYLLAVFVDNFDASCVALAYKILHSQCSNEEIAVAVLLPVKQSLLRVHSPRVHKPNHRC